jgi:hypothetical protein
MEINIHACFFRHAFAASAPNVNSGSSSEAWIKDSFEFAEKIPFLLHSSHRVRITGSNPA